MRAEIVATNHKPTPHPEEHRAAMRSAQVWSGAWRWIDTAEWQGHVGMHKTSSARRLLPSPLWFSGWCFPEMEVHSWRFITR